MITVQPIKRRRSARVRAPLLLGALLLVLLRPTAFSAPAQPGFFVRYAETELRNEVYYLSAEAELNLTGAVVEALDSGVALPIDLQIEVINPRGWIWDETVYSLRQRYRVKYHALSGQYLVTNLNSRVQYSYPARSAALSAVGSIGDLPMLDRSALDVGQTYEVRLRARLAVEDLPSPLRVWAYISSDWDLVSDWYRWPLR